ncbi:hypothetical protein BSK59_13500 [Paenibacillus odorifer]|uniref:hypothetical protein n=1 Tax=Paenibacillus odorifer TaxID=189426 RepID=UPI00096E7384|nr:hypothetical protein [Paenibacillus odorifer]OME55486.1 hypothetical protein BSK59_13500 [Paenibacillus odorifer]
MQQITADELGLVKSYLEIPFLLEVLEGNIEKMKHANLRLGHIFVFHLVTIRDNINREYIEIKKKMRNKGIKVFDQETTKIEITAKYVCRGYIGNMKLLMERVKSDLCEMLAKQLGLDLAKMMLME